MAKGKKKTNVKKNNAINNNLNRPRNIKKKVVINDEIKKENTIPGLVKMPSNDNMPKIDIRFDNTYKQNKVLTKEEIIRQRKERNRKKYQNKQKRIQYYKNNNVKKKIAIPDEVNDNKEKILPKEEDLVKKTSSNINIEDEENKKKEKERKEKRKFNRKSIHLTQTLANIKNKGVDTLNNVKEKVNDKNIPVGKTEDDKKKRFKRIIKESIIYTVVLTIVDIGCILVFDYFNFLRLFDVKWLNIVVTVIICLIFNFFIAFMIDYFTTEIWLRRKRQKKVDDANGDSRINEEEHREDIEEKEGE